MKGSHLFEFMDFDWFPKCLRDLITDVLEKMGNDGSGFDPIIPIIKMVMEKSDTHQIIDLCSGGGGPWLGLIKLLRKEDESVKVTFTDKYPNNEAVDRICKMNQDNLKYLSISVDASQVPSELEGVRTIFGGFHHMKPSMAQAIFKDAAEKGKGIIVGEALLMTPLIAWITLPIQILLSPIILVYYWIKFAKVMRGKLSTVIVRLLFTYLIPIAPLVMMFDAFMSIVRVYDKNALEEITNSIQIEGYVWKVEVVKNQKNLPPIIYAAGYPEKK